MKFWRTTAVVALAVAFTAVSAFAAMAPKAPAAAGLANSNCIKNTETAPVFPIVLCYEMQETTSTGVGNGFPWENSTFFFSSFRNQFLFDSGTVNNTRNTSCTMESLQSRSVSFSAASTNVYGDFGPGDPSFIKVTDAVADTLSPQFDLNTGATPYCEINSNAGPFTIGSEAMPSGDPGFLSTCDSCALGDMWCVMADSEAAFAALTNILVDSKSNVVPGGGGNGIWDTTSTAFGEGCSGPTRAFGSGSFANSQHLTTALGVDEFNFVWVFDGTAPPPPATVEQQIKEIVRLLLTPQGLRCSGLDLTPGNDKIEDDPIAFPNGSRVDPIQPQISTNGTITGDEMVDGLRQCGWACP